MGAIGFCMGGALTLLSAEFAGVDAASPFYGTPPPEEGHVSSSLYSCMTQLGAAHTWYEGVLLAWQPYKIKVPVQAHVGAEDSMKVSYTCCMYP